MDTVHIAELTPELPACALKQFRAAVTLIWPYSSSQREFALLLSEPDFRLRRKKGQVRARFIGSSARALATTGVGIGDEVVLSLKGAQFVQEGTVNTPGKSIDWELQYTQTVAVQIFRDGSELASLDMADVAPTPAPRSPVRRDMTTAPTPAKQWSSPAYLKRARLSDGPFFQAPQDPLAAETEEGHDKKRRRKSYRDWKAWTYSARTPSPAKSDVEDEEEVDGIDASPSRPSQLPHTPVSPSTAETHSVATRLLPKSDSADNVGQEAHVSKAVSGADNVADHDEIKDNAASAGDRTSSPRVNGRFDIYAVPNRTPPADDPYAYGGDTEPDTEEDYGMEDTDGGSVSPIEIDAEVLEDDQALFDDEPIEYLVAANERKKSPEDAGSAVQNDGFAEKMDARPSVDGIIEEDEDEDDKTPSVMADELTILEGIHKSAMPPPTLPVLNTQLLAPASPTLHPLDSATLPMPSPFPGEPVTDIASYFDQFTNEQQHGETATGALDEPELPNEADYIFDNSFFNSIGSSKPSALHPDHETAFTPVRFTFGMDGAGFSRPMELSSPAPEKPYSNVDNDTTHDSEAERILHEQETAQFSTHKSPDHLEKDEDEGYKDHQHLRSALFSSPPRESSDINTQAASPSYNGLVDVTDEREVIELSSDSESASSEAGNMQVNAHGEERASSLVEIDEEDVAVQPHTEPDSTNPSAVATVVDLGSPSDDSSDVGELVADVEMERLETFQPADDVQHSSAYQDWENSQSASQHGTATTPRSSQSHSELQAVDFTHTPPNVPSTAQAKPSTHTPTLQTLEDLNGPDDDSGAMLIDEPYVTTEDMEMYTHGDYLSGETFHEASSMVRETEEEHQDIKMESIEEDLFHPVDQVDRLGSQTSLDDSAMAPPSEILIAVPEEGHKLGELHTVSVPGTGPARNTRSKTMASISPTRDETSTTRRATRSSRSRVSAIPSVQMSASPTRMRDVSMISLSQDPPRLSPYSLRSQSKQISPPKSKSAVRATRQSPRKHASQRSVDSVTDVGSSQRDDGDPFLTSFQPSQELGASQDKYSNVSFVKDSEEESLHSEHSISTLNKFSDDWTTFTILSDPVVPYEQDEPENLKPPPATAPEARTRTSAKTQWKKFDKEVVVLDSSPTQHDFSFITQPPPSSPSRKLRSSASFQTVSPSPRVMRTTRRRVYDLSSSPPPVEEDQVTPKARRLTTLIYPARPSEGERSIPSSPPAQADMDELMQSPPRAPSSELATPRHRRTTRSNRPMTPEATQQTTMDSQTSLDLARPQQSSPITPQLTQATLAHRSFTRCMNLPNTIPETLNKSSPITGSTPRRNATQTDVASPSTSPQAHSPDASSDAEASVIDKPEGPSIGLSTPLAYYTPLSSLPYFLNRSSQFHTDSNPDILALVTSGTTPPVRATKGPKHWTTALHITDLSTWPATTTVNIFRAYQTALPHADTGDVILLRTFAVKSLNRHPMLISADESSWCVWRYGKPVWGKKKGAFGEVRAREEMKGPVVERGEGEWREVERVRRWYTDGGVKGELEGMEGRQRMTRSHDKGRDVAERDGDGEGRVTRSHG